MTLNFKYGAARCRPRQSHIQSSFQAKGKLYLQLQTASTLTATDYTLHYFVQGFLFWVSKCRKQTTFAVRCMCDPSRGDPYHLQDTVHPFGIVPITESSVAKWLNLHAHLMGLQSYPIRGSLLQEQILAGLGICTRYLPCLYLVADYPSCLFLSKSDLLRFQKLSTNEFRFQHGEHVQDACLHSGEDVFR